MPRALLPGAAVFVAVLVMVRIVGDVTLDLITGRYGIVLYAAGALLAGFFHRSRIVPALVGLARVDLIGAAAAEGVEIFIPLATLLHGSPRDSRARARPRSPVPRGEKAKKKRKRPKKLSVTVSVGLADSTGNDSDPEGVLKRADEALYRAKRDGRNRVTR